MVTIIVPKAKKIEQEPEEINEDSIKCSVCGRETVFGLRKKIQHKDKLGRVEHTEYQYVCLMCVSKGKFV